MNFVNTEPKPKPTSKLEYVPIIGTKWIKRILMHTFTLPNGNSGRWESVDFGDEPSVLICGLTEEREMILVNIFRFPVQEYCLELPGGEIKPDENPTEAIIREFKEETGFMGEKTSLLCKCFAYNGKTNKSFLIFLAEGCKKVSSPNLDEVEKYAGLEFITLPIREIKKMVARGDINIDPPISHAIIALEEKGLA
ncbi:MAG TPA: NUDIX hydrolase [Candidatus Paceibacterota bacterium]|nr:NUDIX hydrolase [Candidatus Paceibacterota bacterium]